MLHTKAFANAATIVSVVLYAGCRLLSLIAPDFLFSVAKSWFHTFSIDSLKGTTSMDFGSFVLGGIVLAVLVWITVYSTIALYNKLAK